MSKEAFRLDDEASKEKIVPKPGEKPEKSPDEIVKDKAKEKLEKSFELFAQLAGRYIEDAAKNHPDKAAIMDRINSVKMEKGSSHAMVQLGEGICEAYEYKYPSLKKNRVSTDMVIQGSLYDFFKFIDSVSKEYDDNKDFKQFRKALREFVQPEKYKQLIVEYKALLKKQNSKS